jgi:hypothetical protein
VRERQREREWEGTIFLPAGDVLAGRSELGEKERYRERESQRERERDIETETERER